MQPVDQTDVIAAIGTQRTKAMWYAESDGDPHARTYYVVHTHRHVRHDCGSWREARLLAQRLNRQDELPWRKPFPTLDDYDAYWRRQPRRVINRARLRGVKPSAYANQMLRRFGFKEIFNSSTHYDVVVVDGHAQTYTEQDVLELFVSRLRTAKACRMRQERHYKRMVRYSQYLVNGTWNQEQLRDLRDLRADIPEEDVIAAMERQRDSDNYERRRAAERAFEASWPTPGD